MKTNLTSPEEKMMILHVNEVLALVHEIKSQEQNLLPLADLVQLGLSHENLRNLVKDLLVELQDKGSENKVLIETAKKVVQNLD